MTALQQFPQDWQRALVLVAHPDDPESTNPYIRYGPGEGLQLNI